MRLEYRSGSHWNPAEMIYGIHRNSAELRGKMSILNLNITVVELLEIARKA